MFFTNIDAVKASDNAGVRFRPPRPDRSIPTTDEEKQEIVRALIEAIYDTSDTAEVGTTEAFQHRWVKRHHYHPSGVEKVAWKLLDKTIKLHRFGWMAPVYDETVMVDVMKTSLLKGDKYWTVIGMPALLLSRSKMNKESNKKKKARLEYARGKEK
ncbi:uncharacterized protein EI97DRAFT_352895, partial [Westerdykella ornata]